MPKLGSGDIVPSRWASRLEGRLSPLTPRSSSRSLYALLLLLALSVSACATSSSHLSGRVVLGARPLAGAIVTARGTDGGIAAQAVTDDEGVYRLPPLPPGSYRLAAKAEGDPPVEAVAGKNPIHLAPGAKAWMGLQAVPKEKPTFAPLVDSGSGFGSLSGAVRFEGRTVSGAVVYLYLDESQGLKGPGFRQSFPTALDGTYALDEVPEGSYYVAVRKRQRGGTSGPVREGDLYGVALTNPVPLYSQQETRLDLHVVRKVRDDDPNADLLALTGTGIRGRVVDPSGRPASDLYVFAYRNRIIGHGMPDFLTLPTGPSGTYALSLGEGGLFYVGARELSGGSPAPGEYFGFYEGSPDHGIVVPKGRVIDGVEIVVRKVLEP